MTMKRNIFKSPLRWQRLVIGAAALALTGFQLTAQGLNITVTGAVGSGETTWTFSGGYTVTGAVQSGINDTGINYWTGGLDLTDNAFYNSERILGFMTTNATVTRTRPSGAEASAPLNGVVIWNRGSSDFFAWHPDSAAIHC